MSDLLRQALDDIERRLRTKRLFDGESASISLRVPGQSAALFAHAGDEPRTVSFSDGVTGDAALHACVYQARPDVGGIFVGTTMWMTALAALGVALPSLFDEQARHIGRPAAPVAPGDLGALAESLANGANAVLVGTRRVGLGSTPNRVVLNGDLFEKCAKAFVLAASTGQPVRPLPAWASALWYEHLRKDQRRAASAYRSGRVPEGMDAY
jgi:ribulose-5-phosphate 4-epimerase/fuculose-1-phosphate aldolase